MYELDQLIQQLPITEPLSVHEFISIDDNIEQEEVSISEIVDVVLERGLEDNDKEESEEKISLSEALNSIEALITFIKQSEWGVDTNFYCNLVKLQKEFVTQHRAEKNKLVSINFWLIFDYYDLINL